MVLAGLSRTDGWWRLWAFSTPGLWVRSSTWSSKSRPDRPHPLFYGFVKAALEQMQGKENMDESL